MSSSSSLEYFVSSSSSSSFAYSSSSSSLLSSSSNSNSSSSSSSIDSSSSSSSSFLENKDERLIPFKFKNNYFNPIWDLCFHEEYCYAGTFEEILFSRDRYSWQTLFKVKGEHIKSIILFKEFIWGCSSPSGKIYKINPSSLEVQEYKINRPCVKLFQINNKLFLVSDRAVYKFSNRHNRWESIYEIGYKINNIKIINNIGYLCLNAPFFITFDGDSFAISNSSNNLLTSSRVSIVREDPTSFLMKHQNIDSGINDIISHKKRLYLGGNKFAKIYEYLDEKYDLYFETGSNKVHCLHSINEEGFLASIKNQLFLIFEHNFSTEESSIEEVERTEESSIEEVEKNINIVSPVNGDFLLGSEIVINWTSKKGLNDAVKIDLYKGGSFLRNISQQTLNSGQFFWNSPIGLDTGDDYQIYIEWLSSGQVSELDKDLGGEFSISLSLPEEIESTGENTTAKQIDKNEKKYFVPILDLPLDEYITTIEQDNKQGLLLGTSKGRILSASNIDTNSYLTGDRHIYGQIKDSYNHISKDVSSPIFYALYQKLLKINQNKEIEGSIFKRNVIVDYTEDISGVFISDAFYLQEEGSFWTTLMWEEISNEQQIKIYLRFGDSLEELYQKQWGKSYESDGENGVIIKNLDNIINKGRYAQIKCELIASKEQSPEILNVSIGYTAKNASYFFTTLFSLVNEANAKNALITGTISEPSETEIVFGVNNKDSSDWNDYKEVPLNKLFSLENWENLKVGIKFISYGENFASASEFSIITGSELKKIL